MRRRRAAGEGCARIAREMGRGRNTVIRHTRDVKVPEGTECPCGLPAGHLSACLVLTPDKSAIMKARLIAGDSRCQIAKDLGVSERTLFAAARPIVDALRAAGVKCRCGRDRGHSDLCAPFRHIEATAELKADVRRLLAGGMVEWEIADELGVRRSLIKWVGRDLRVELAREGVCCPCGRPIDHPSACASRRRTHGTPNVRYTGAALMIGKRKRCKVAEKLRAGREPWRIAKTMGIERRVVDSIREQIEAFNPERRAAFKRIRQVVPRSLGLDLRRDVIEKLEDAVDDGMPLDLIEAMAEGFGAVRIAKDDDDAIEPRPIGRSRLRPQPAP
jgi:DNA-binding CsgD family transcriptional regulator